MPNFEQIHNIDDFKKHARRYLPKPLFDFIEGGAEDEIAIRNNRAAFERIRFRPRTIADVETRSLTSSLFGKPMAAPIGVSPMGGLSNFAPHAEIAMARACAKAGIPYGLSTVAAVTPEQLREAAPDARLWFQLYMMNEERLNRHMIDSAARAGFEALLVTTDTHVTPKRERDRRNGFALTLKKTPANVLRVAMKPRWIWDVMIRQGLPRFEILHGVVPEIVDNPSSTKFFGANRRYAFDYDDLRAIRRMWKGQLLIKGVMRPDEALQALDAGADGIIITNHGGRNLDHAAAPIEMLPEVVDAVGKRMTVIVDSGFRRGTDVVKALALGANAVMFGRPAVYAAAAAGEAGVAHFIHLMKDEIDRTLGYLGCTSVDQLGRDHLLIDRFPPRWNEPGV
jgi:isopentenyl diphosphate isomerase/L-lactate dehydrogenase-like FMN-dependent dehydrogenase